jgi:transposase-like protein
MEISELKTALLSLSPSERASLLTDIERETSLQLTIIENRRDKLNNKIGNCPHCNSKKYRKNGIDKGSQRYYCNNCRRTFTEYTGTWMASIHKKDLLGDYLKLMEQELSLDKIKERLKINKKTAFDWRHKVLSGLDNVDMGEFTGITESDETFFLLSEKGKEQEKRLPRKRGGKANQRGISDEQVAVIVTTDRNSEMDMTVAKLGRIRKTDIESAIGQRVSEKTILCSDGHVSYKGFAIDKILEHHALRADLKQYVKQGIYHIQHVNSIDNRLKKWIENRFWGVSTKYLQKYLNWFKVKERLKNSKEYLKEFSYKTIEDNTTWRRFKDIERKYCNLIVNTALN